MSANPKLIGPFPGDVKPERSGVYHIAIVGIGGGYYSLYKGGVWHSVEHIAEQAEKKSIPSHILANTHFAWSGIGQVDWENALADRLSQAKKPVLKKPRLTREFCAQTEPPVRDGVYPVKVPATRSGTLFCKFFRGNWLPVKPTAESAETVDTRGRSEWMLMRGAVWWGRKR